MARTANKNLWVSMAAVFGTAFLFTFLLAAELTPLRSWGRLAAGQFENFVFSGLITLPLLGLSSSRLARQTYAVLITVMCFYLTANQVFYRFFTAPFQLGLVEGQEGSLSAFRDSILFELDAKFYANVALAMVLGLLLFLRLQAPQEVPRSAPSKKLLYGVGVGVLAIAYGLVSRHFNPGKLQSLNLHPVVALGKSFLSPPRHDTPPAKLEADLGSLRFGQPTPMPLATDIWQLGPTHWSLLTSKPNIVLIVLESVGSEQLLVNGKLNPERTPALARHGAQMTAFSQLYDIFPGTVRSHTPLATGGRDITWGSVYDELSATYVGPTIASELKAAGYSTAVFSAAYMESENLGGFYNQLPFDVRDYPDQWPALEQSKFKINSWGVDEREVIRRGMIWAKATKAPFFLQILTSATHHPYSIPQDFKAPGPVDDDRRHRYNNALAFLDHVVDGILADLKKADHADDTLVFIVGDHGEAFGDLHSQNFTHKNHIYDENIRNFLLLIDPRLHNGPMVIPRIGEIGDVAPTVLAFVDAKPRDFAGQNLYAPAYRERLVFFHKNAYPERWGLRDGRWKFAIDKVGATNPELYDLDHDATEQVNLAASHQDQVQQYQKLVASWYIQTNDEYVKRLKNFRKAGGIQLRPDEVQSFGPKRLVFGTKGKGGKFVELQTINPAENMEAWTYGVPFPHNQKVNYEWTSPTGEVRRFHFEFDKDWSQTEVFHSAQKPMEPGVWRLNLSANGQPLLSGTFVVSASAELHNRRTFP